MEWRGLGKQASDCAFRGRRARCHQDLPIPMLALRRKCVTSSRRCNRRSRPHKPLLYRALAVIRSPTKKAERVERRRMSYMPTEPFVPGDDSEHRDRRLLRATIWCAQIGEQDILIRNFSRRGLGGSTSRSPVCPGIEVTVTLPTGLQMTGTVRWARENAFGIRLHQPIDPIAVANDVRRQAEAARPAVEWEVHSRHRTWRTDPGLPTRPV